MMVKFLLVCLILLVPLYSAGQLSDSTKRRKSLIAFFNPGMTYRTVNYQAPEEWIKQSRDAVEIPKFAFDAGLLLAIPFKDRITLRAGLQYSNKGYRTIKQPLLWAITHASLPRFARSIVSYHSIGIPLEIQLTSIERKRFIVNAFAGFVPEIVLTTNSVVKTYIDGESSSAGRSSKSVGFAKTGLGARIGVEVVYHLSNRCSLISGMLFQYSISSRLVSSTAVERGYGAYGTFGFARRF